MPAAERWFDDFRVGESAEFGALVVSEAAILDFARSFDPQAFHTDPVAARSGPYGGLIASGWHTAAMTMRLLADHFIPANAAMGSPGVDELRWLKPVRPGDTLRVRAGVTGSTPSRSKPDRGIVHTLVETLNQHDEVVMSFRAMGMYRRRPNQEPAT